MSIQALVWVIEYSESRLADRRVLVSIANHCDRLGQNAWPSVKTISHEAKVTTRQVQLSLRRLIKMGELTISRNQGPHGTNLYTLPQMTRNSQPLLADTAVPKHGGEEFSGAKNPPGEKWSLLVKDYARNGQDSSPEPSVNPSIEPSSEDIHSWTPEHAQNLPAGASIPTPNPWRDLKRRLKKIIDRQSFETWFEPMDVGYAMDGTIFLTVPTRDWQFVVEHFGDLIRKTLSDSGLPYTDFALQVRPKSERQKRA